MTSEMGEMFNEMRRQRQLRRRATQEEADNSLPALRERLTELGASITTPSPHHWQIWDREGELIGNYWPSTMKAQPNGGSVHTGVTLTSLYGWVKNRV